ncbi:MAG: DUF1636 family protein [Deltaproteobacteria bacterium]|nr:DUF1636 family protein [Deltaproteobacteria bacterium]
MPSDGSTQPLPLFVCRNCRPAGEARTETHPGARMVSEVTRALVLASALDAIVLLPIHCLNRCDHGCTAAILPENGPRIVLDSLEPTQATARAIVRYALEVHRAGHEVAPPEGLSLCPARGPLPR